MIFREKHLSFFILPINSMPYRSSRKYIFIYFIVNHILLNNILFYKIERPGANARKTTELTG